MSTAPAGRLSPEQYMDLLLERQAAYDAQHPRVLGFPPLLEWFIRDGDEDLVDMDAIDRANRPDPAPRPAPEPRYYKPASHWRARLERIDAELDRLNGVQRHATDDPAAYGGLGVRQTPRQRRQYAARIDRTAERHVRLTRERAEVVGKLRRAERRESS